MPRDFAEMLQIAGERGIAFSVGDNLRSDLLTQRFSRRGTRLNIRFRGVTDPREGVGFSRRQLREGGNRCREGQSRE